MSEVSKIFYRFQGFKCYVCGRCRRLCLQLLRNTAYRVLLLISLMSKMPNIIVLCIQGPSPLQGGRLFIWALRPVGLAVHHHAVQGGSFVLKCSGTCQTTRVIAGKMHSQSQILKCYGAAQQPGNSYKSMTKLHPPHSNWTCHKQII